MPYEIIHDTIARLVYDKSSAEARTRRKIEREIRERYVAYQERDSRLSQEDLDYFTPWLDRVNISSEEAAFLESERAFLFDQREAKAAAQRRRTRWAMVAVAVLLISLLISFGFYSQSQDALAEARHNDSIAQANAREAGIAKDEAFEALSEADRQRIIADSQRVFALFQKGEAETQKENAEREAYNAKIALAEAERSDSIAQLRAEEAQLARLEAVSSDSASQAAALRAEIAAAEAKQASIEARSAALAAQARQFAGDDPTLGLQLAFAARQVFDGEDANSVFEEMIANDSAFAAKKVQIGSTNYALAENSAKKIVVTVGLGGAPEVRSAIDGRLLATIQTNGLTCNGITFSPDGENLLASVVQDSVSLLILYDQEFKEVNRVEWKAESMSSLVCGQKYIAAGTNTGDIRVYKKNLEGGPVLEYSIPREYGENERAGVDYDERFSNPIALLGFDSLENKILVGANYNEKAFLLGISDNSRRTIKISRKIKKAMEIRYENRPLISVGNGMFLPNNAGFIISYPLHGVVSFDSDGRNQSWIPLAKDGYLKEIALSRSGKYIYLVQENGVVTEIDRHVQGRRNEIKITDTYKVGNEISHAVRTENGKLLITTTVGELYFFDTSRTKWGRFRIHQFFEKSYGRFASCGQRGELLIYNKLYSSSSGEFKKTLSFDVSQTAAVAFSPGGDTLLLRMKDQTVLLWDVNLDKEISVLPIPGDVSYGGFVCLADGQSFLVGQGVNLIRYSMTGQKLDTVARHDHPITAVGISPDRDLVLTGDQKEMVSFFRLSTGKQVRGSVMVPARQRSDLAIHEISFSPDGELYMIDGRILMDAQELANPSYNFPQSLDVGTPARFSSDNSSIFMIEYSRIRQLWNPYSHTWPSFLATPTDDEREKFNIPDGVFDKK